MQLEMPAKKPVKIQLAIQGGGARLCALLAAAAPFQTLHHDKEIEITQIAGTSAGSIIGALIASSHNLNDVRATLLAKEKAYWEGLFPKMGIPKIAAKILLNWPIYNLD